MPVRLLHLSDLHLTERPGTDADRSLELVLNACEYVCGVEAIVVTGDVADDGSLAAYRRARSRLSDVAAARDVPVVFCVGNHDERGAFTAILGDGYIDSSDERSKTRGPADMISTETLIGGIRLITLDSLVPGMVYGRIGEAQLAWLRELLVADATTPTVLAFHHPPIDIGIEIQRRVRLADAGELASVVREGTVVAILCGHFHQQLAGSFAGIPTWVTPGVASRIDHLSVPAGHERGLRGGAASVVDLTDPRAPLFAMVPALDPTTGHEMFSTTPDEIDPVLDQFGLSSAHPER